MSVTKKIADYRQDGAKILISCEKSRGLNFKAAFGLGASFAI